MAGVDRSGVPAGSDLVWGSVLGGHGVRQQLFVFRSFVLTFREADLVWGGRGLCGAGIASCADR
eukprot:2586982-Rhodomonas_salina.4